MTIQVRNELHCCFCERNLTGNWNTEAIALVAAILPLVALFQVFDATSAVTGGIMRAMGKQFTGALLNLR